jgi:hypothetical protein
MAASAGDMATLGDCRSKLLTCPESGDFLPTIEPRHIMPMYKPFLGELSTVLPVYPEVEWLCLNEGRKQPNVE